VARVLRMPGVAANATEAVLAEWLVEESADFAAADALATVETEKAAVDVEADAAGKVLKTLVPPGAQVEVGDPIAVLGDPGEQVDDLDELLASLGVAPATDVTIPERRDVPTDPESAAPLAEELEMPATPVPRSAGSANGRVFASPLARKIAKAAGIGIEEIAGSGPRGRILRRDVDVAIADRRLSDRSTAPREAVRPGDSAESVRGATSAETGTYEEVPHSRIRLATARRLTESKQHTPHFYVRATVRAEPLLALRTEVNEVATTRVSINDLVVKAVAVAHQRMPDMNVVWTADALRRFETVDVSIAVATDRGLLTPVVRDVGSLTLTSLVASIRDLADRARDGKLQQHELEGGSISVSNLGMYGVDEFAAIINPPQSAILAMGAVREEPVVADGEIVAGQVMSLTLSVDHRSIDGALAARWLAVLVELLQHPVRMLT
jgi:pyruvate dehydrogenase E2 component (dihydrolipoamide acetyltransferase)